MEDYISFSEGLLVAVVSITAVFVVLIVIAFVISGLKIFSREKKDTIQDRQIKVKKSIKPLIISEDPNVITEELVAVIAAAIAANSVMDIPDINIRSITQVS